MLGLLRRRAQPLRPVNWLRLALLLAAFTSVAVPKPAGALELLVEGRATVSTIFPPPVGVPGETIDISVRLDSRNFTARFLPSTSTQGRMLLEPIEPILFDIVGQQTGSFPGPPEVRSLQVVDLVERSSSGFLRDQIRLDQEIGSDGSALLQAIFDTNYFTPERPLPRTAEGVFELFLASLQPGSGWIPNGQEFAGGQGRVPINGLMLDTPSGVENLRLATLEWTVSIVPEPSACLLTAILLSAATLPRAGDRGSRRSFAPSA